MLALSLSLKDNTELNQHSIGKYVMQCCPNKLTYIKALSWELFLSRPKITGFIGYFPVKRWLCALSQHCTINFLCNVEKTLAR